MIHPHLQSTCLSFTIVLLRWPSKVRSRHLLGCNSLKSLRCFGCKMPTLFLDSWGRSGLGQFISRWGRPELCETTPHFGHFVTSTFFFWGRAIPSSFRIYCGRAVFWQRFFGWGGVRSGLWKNPSNFQQKPLIEANSFVWWLCIIQLQGPTSWLKMAGKIQENFLHFLKSETNIFAP